MPVSWSMLDEPAGAIAGAAISAENVESINERRIGYLKGAQVMTFDEYINGPTVAAALREPEDLKAAEIAAICNSSSAAYDNIRRLEKERAELRYTLRTIKGLWEGERKK